MVIEKKINVEVVYATVSQQKIIALQLLAGSSLEQAIQQSGILLLFPEINLAKNKVGIFSAQKKLTDVVHDGDRIEIYRPLIIDPKEARRRRVKNNKEI